METSARRAQLISSTLAGQARAGQDVAGLERTIADLRGRADDADVRALVADLKAQRESLVRLQDKLERFEVGHASASAPRWDCCARAWSR